MDYDGGRTRSDIVSRALDLFSDNAPPPELLEVNLFITYSKECFSSLMKDHIEAVKTFSVFAS